MRLRGPQAGFLAILGTVAALCLPALAQAAVPVLKPSKGYTGQSTFRCRTDAIAIHPGQNINDIGTTQTCPHAVRVRGTADPATFNPGSQQLGYVTRFKPGMVEVHDDGSTTTPRVWDLHLHHVVWMAPNGSPIFASGEEKTIQTFPQGYGYRVAGGANWGINQMIHELNSRDGRSVYLTWEIDWVPATASVDNSVLKPVNIQWMDVAGAPHIYPVFDVKQSYDGDGNGNFVFPDDVSSSPSGPSYAERSNISQSRRWTVPGGGATLVFTAGHLHPGGLHTDMVVSRDGPDPGSTAGDTPSETVPLFRSDAQYFEPAGATSWDVAMTATSRDWRVHLKAGDVVSISATYDVSRADWYEVMGIMPLAWSPGTDPAAKDPFDDAAAVKAMYDAGGILTHARLGENKDSQANKELKLPDPSLLPNGPAAPAGGVDIDSFFFQQGGFSAVRGFPKSLMSPVLVKAGTSLSFTNKEALSAATNENQVWHSITTCANPCNRGSGIGYPLAGPVNGVDFDSGQLGYGKNWSSEVTTGSNRYTTPVLTQPGTYTYFCRIHPFMRGSFRVLSAQQFAAASGTAG